MLIRTCLFHLCLFIVLVTVLYSPRPGHALSEPVTQSLQQQLTTRVHNLYPQATVTTEVIDKQTLYKPCFQATTEITGQNVVGRIPIRVRCQGQTPWSYFAYATVKAVKKVFVAKHPIRRGAEVSSQDLVHSEIAVDPRQRYFLSKAPIVGQLAARNIAANQPILAQHLKKPLAVRRGDLVIIRARHGAATISATGKAMKSGHIGDQIPVKNAASQRVIHSWIVAKGLVDTRAVRG